MPYGSRINMGAYGGTVQASRSPQQPLIIVLLSPNAGPTESCRAHFYASAWDSDGCVVNVEFYVGDQQVIQSQECYSPESLYWEHDWDAPMGGGPFVITAQATDNDGLTTRTSPVTITTTCSNPGGRGR